MSRTEELGLRRGDHIYVYRSSVPRLYSHHGIYIGSHNDKENMVIHYTRPSSDLDISPCQYCGYAPRPTDGVVMSCLDCFLKGGQLRIYEYNVGYIRWKPKGSCSFFPSRDDPCVVDAALECLRKGFGNYNLVLNNCEDFAHYCKTGWRFSAQSFYRSGYFFWPFARMFYPVAKGLYHLVDEIRET